MELQKHFDQLVSPNSWQSPLAVIAHIDLDAFYAQCQTVNENIDPTEPLGCRQWHSLIAVNYPARKFGIKRSMSITEAKKLCPEIHLPHVPTFAKGQKTWTIEKEPNASSHKVSLDLFRRESRKIFKIFRKNYKIVEKAGIDEGFVNLSSQVHARAIELYPQLNGQNGDDPLPELPKDVEIEWFGVLVRDDASTPFKPRTWHDVLIALGSEMVWRTRLEIHDTLKYTCSAGIASTKLTAKLGSAFNKPFNQTVIPQSLIEEFLDKVKLKDVWGWGGKLGIQVEDALNLPQEQQMSHIRKIPLESLRASLNSPENALSLYRMVRGIDYGEVQSRTTIKSMASVKNFTKALETRKDIHEWVVVYCADLAGRLIDINEDEGLALRPKVVSVQYALNGTHHSKQMQVASLATVPDDRLYDELYELAIKIVDDVVPIPCKYLSIELSKIDKMPKQSMFFKVERGSKDLDQDSSYLCPECGRKILITSKQEHSDFHFALNLDKQEQKNQIREVTPPTPKKQRTSKQTKASSDPKQGSLEAFLKKK